MISGRLILLLTVLIVLLNPIYSYAGSADTTDRNNRIQISEPDILKVEKYIHEQMKQGKIPGASVVIVEGSQTIYQKGFGFANVKQKQPVTSGTFFELGSNSKAFTGLGILYLKEKGLLRLEEPISKYLPWLKMKYKGKHVEVTLEQFLHHTSGVPFKTIGEIPPGEDENALEDTVRLLVDRELSHKPGAQFLYATINYDVLGLVIQKVSGQSYESFMEKNILQPMGLSQTYLFHSSIPAQKMAKGYKIGFAQALRYDAPIYRGNTPAGYILSNGEDMAKWLQIQLGTANIPDFYKQLVTSSHEPDRTVYPQYVEGTGGLSYGAGWFASLVGEEFTHTGSNPNFSSSIAFRSEEKLGVAVLTNINSAYSNSMALGILNTLLGKDLSEESDQYRSIDNASIVIISICCLLILTLLFLIGKHLMEVFKKKRNFTGAGILEVFQYISTLLFVGLIGYCLYCIPNILFWGLSWGFAKVWAPGTFKAAVSLLFVSTVLLYIYYLVISLFRQKSDKLYFFIVVLGTVSGLGNAIIIFTINQAVSADMTYRKGLLLYFVTGIIIYIIGQRVIRSKMITLTNNLVYEKRMDLARKILSSTYQSMDSVENGKIHAALNNDTEVVSNFANTVIGGFTSSITLVCCFIYLGVLNFYGLAISMGIIFLAACLYLTVSRMSQKLWKETRDIQNKFFKFIYEMTLGFKELSMNKEKRREFTDDLGQSCETYRKKRIKADINFTNVFVTGELLFTLVIGIAAFAFPVVLNDVKDSNIRNFIFVFLYMTGPVHGILNTIPNIIQFRISWKRIQELESELSQIEVAQSEGRVHICQGEKLSLTVKDVKYQYITQNQEAFQVGPINYDFNAGEIVFITGGNGSGKTTLAKMITGLYVPTEGEITLLAPEAGRGSLSEYFSAIFGDFYLFEKLYGIDYQNKLEDIEKYLKILKIKDKLNIEDGLFDTIKLSTGQRKRIALLISYLEDKPIVLFDEWAADQDVEFREFFYCTLLPELKQRGKCVIAITHDDRYFHVADKVIRMQLGRMTIPCK